MYLFFIFFYFPGYVQVKEMSFLASIEKHDLDIKKKQLAQWIEKKYHVRVTVTKRRAADGPGKEVSLIFVG